MRLDRFSNVYKGALQQKFGETNDVEKAYGQ